MLLLLNKSSYHNYFFIYNYVPHCFYLTDDSKLSPSFITKSVVLETVLV